jgi:hypothetical protein
MIIKSKNAKRELDMKQIVLIVIVVLGVLVFFWIFVSAMQCIYPYRHECIWIAYVVLVGIALVAVVVGYQIFRVITA